MTFLTPISRSKVIRRSKSYDMSGPGQWSYPPSLVKICQVMTELQRDWQKKKERKKEFYKDRTRRHVCRLVRMKVGWICQRKQGHEIRTLHKGRLQNSTTSWPVVLGGWYHMCCSKQWQPSGTVGNHPELRVNCRLHFEVVPNMSE